jgi:S-DNA-T family DNA segregation ATPase FtsK/SpoIIIE
MGRKRKKKKESFLSNMREETVETILAILFFVVAGLLLLATFGQGGLAGEKVVQLSTFLFGIGFYLIPIILILLGISFFREIKNNFATPKIIASIVLFIAGLSFVDLTFDKGGVVGSLLAQPMISLFDFWGSLLITLALVAISLVFVFEASLKLSSIKKIFSKKEGKNEEFNEDENLYDDEYEEEEEYEEEDEEEEEEDDEETEPEKTSSFGFKSKKGNGLVFFPGNSISKKDFTPPPLSLLQKDSGKPGVGDIKANGNIIRRTLHNFGIQVEMDEVSIGPSVTRYALKPAEGVKLSKIVGLQNDLALALAAHPLRIEAPIPGKSLVGIEIPNTKKTLVGLGSLLSDPSFQNTEKPLLTCLGKGITGQAHFSDIGKMPHMLIAGATGSGKSVTAHTLITSLLYRNSPDNLKFIMVDPKRVELTLYNNIPHLLTNVITDAKKAILALKWAAKEMDRRYDILEEYSARDISSYHNSIIKPAVEKAKTGGDDADLPPNMPHIMIIIDELADIMQTYPRELESAIVRLAQMSRAVGIHLILSTQRPSVNVITGLIKANIPTRLALKVASQIDSRTILDQPGAEKLLGAGDMLFLSGEMAKPIRIQSAFISEKEVKGLVNWLKDNYEQSEEELNLEEKSGAQTFLETLEEQEQDEDLDDMYNDAKETVISAGKASTSYIQRKLSIGYARAARIMDQLEERGVIGPENGSKPREVLTGDTDEDDNTDRLNKE